MYGADFNIRQKKVEPLTIENQVFKSFYDWTLSEKDLEKACLELGETEERKAVCLQELKKKLSSDTNIKYRLDDSYLLRFLRARKYDVSKAYQSVKTFYDLRKKHSEFFTISPELKSIQELNWATCLPYTDEEGRILLLLNFKKWNPYENTFEEMIRTGANMADLATMNPKVQITGILAIYDVSGMTLKHVSELLWNGRLWAYLSFVLNGYPIRISKCVCLNTNRLVRYVYNLMKPFLKKKITDRCVLLGSDLNDLHQYVNPALLPKRLNGILEEDECNMSQYVLDNLPYIRYERSFSFSDISV